MQNFVSEQQHRACVVDADCAEVAVAHCVPCGRLTLNSSAAKSATWAQLNRDVVSACDNECALCDSFVSPSRCEDGLCR